jgi:hypothetical protein
MDARVRRNVELALACGAPPAMVIAVALMTAAPKSMGEAVELVRAHGPAMADLAARPHLVPRTLAELEPELRAPAEDIAAVGAPDRDHHLRGRLLFRDLVGKKSFFQVAALAIDGLELSERDAELLEHLGVNTQLADPGIWPLNIVRRATSAADVPHALVAGLAALLNPNMAVRPVAEFMGVLDRLETAIAKGTTVDDELERWVAEGARIAGVGRPALGPDERNAQVLALARAYERDGGPSFEMALAVDNFFATRKRVRINSAGLQAAIMRDMGFSPQGAMAFCVIYFMVPVLAHAVFGGSLRKSAGNASRV